jgi:hypothetical protein
MIGRGGSWTDIGQNLNPPLTPEEIRDRLNGIVRRRNQIVHEGDYRRLDRPRDGQRVEPAGEFDGFGAEGPART